MKQKEFTILLDQDGVITNFYDSVYEWYGKKPKDREGHQWDFDYQGEFGLTGNEFWDGLTYDFWANLPKYPWADELLDTLAPFKPIICSAPAWTAAGGKQAWLLQNLPEYVKEGRYILTPSKHLLAGPDRILIDDGPHNCEDFTQAGGKVVIFPQPWNWISSIKTHEDKLRWVYGGLSYYMKKEIGV